MCLLNDKYKISTDVYNETSIKFMLIYYQICIIIAFNDNNWVK